ncbi:MAG: peptide-methionine (S)-S-oxide reductase [Bacteroidetes bacterium]|nr:MAG: peptide-methionine (S)-S-oxide reductase [Bacteroidota bacterium]
MSSLTKDPSPDYSIYQTPNLSESGLNERFAGYERAIFAGGCFWCMEEVFQRVAGVQAVYSGYVGGEEVHPSYREVASGSTGHAEAVVVYYDKELVTYEQLLEFFYASHDPTQVNRQGPDVGRQYRSGVFYLNEAQREAAIKYQQQLNDSGHYNKPIATEITAAGPFYVAEAYHQDYYPQHMDNPYIQRVSKPKVEKFTKAYRAYLKPAYQE